MTASPVYSDMISIPSGYQFIKAIGIASGYPPSAISLASYTAIPQTPPPSISLMSSSYPAGQLVSITDSISTAEIRYTMDGSTPTPKSTLYRGPLSLTGSVTISAISIARGQEPSNSVTATFTVP